MQQTYYIWKGCASPALAQVKSKHLQGSFHGFNGFLLHHRCLDGSTMPTVTACYVALFEEIGKIEFDPITH